MRTRRPRARAPLAIIGLAAATSAATAITTTTGCTAPEDVVVEGRLQRLVMDDRARGASRLLYMLEVAPGDERELVFDGALPRPDLPTGVRIEARGHVLPPLPWNTTPRFAVRALSTATPAGATALPRPVILDPARAPPRRKVAVVLFNFQNDDRQPITPEAIRQRIFTNPNSSRAFHREQSYGFVDIGGKTNPDGDVFGWYTITGFNRPCNHGGWSEEALKIAATQGVDTSGYDHYIFFFPQTDACYFSGIGQQPGKTTWMNGLSIATMNHELGHNLGTPHAASRTCTAANGDRVTLSNNCRDSEYGNPFDVMGGGVRHTNALNKAQARWLSGGNVQYVIGDGVYTLLPQERPSNGVQLLTTVKDEKTHYYVEYRQPFGFDDFPADSPAVNGVIVYLGANLRQLDRSFLLDMTPATTTFGDAPLAVGKTFDDPAAELKITLMSISPASAQVKFEFRGGSNMTVPDGGRMDAAPDVAARPPDAAAADRTAAEAPRDTTATAPDVGVPAAGGAGATTPDAGMAAGGAGGRTGGPTEGDAGCACALGGRASGSDGGAGWAVAALLALALAAMRGRRAAHLTTLALLFITAASVGCGDRAGGNVRPSPQADTAPPPPPADAGSPTPTDGPPRDAAAPADGGTRDVDDGDVANTEDDGGSSSGRIFLYPVMRPIEEACAAYATAYCERLQTCTPRRLAIDHGTLEVCRARRDQACRIDFLAPSRAERPDHRMACTRAIAAQSCRDWYFGRRLPDCDAPPGVLAMGAPCFRSSQCADGLACRIETDETCGTCQKAIPVGGDCSTWFGGCPQGTRCYGDECLFPRKLGEACKMTAAPCELGLECTARGCVEKEAAAGAACAREDVCDPMKDLYCNLKAGLCEPLPPPVPRGMKCGNTTPEGAFLRCDDDAVCFGPSNDPLNRTCIARVALGERCDSITGLVCKSPGVCSQRACITPVITPGGRYLPTMCGRP